LRCSWCSHVSLEVGLDNRGGDDTAVIAKEKT